MEIESESTEEATLLQTKPNVDVTSKPTSTGWKLLGLTVLVVMLVTLIDAIVAAKAGMIKFELNSVDVSLGGTAADVSVSISSRASFLSHLHSARLSPSASQICEIATNQQADEMKRVTSVSITSDSMIKAQPLFASSNQHPDLGEVNVTLDFVDIDYHSVHRLTMDPTSVSTVGLVCTVNVVFYAYSFIPITLPPQTVNQAMQLNQTAMRLALKGDGQQSGARQSLLSRLYSASSFSVTPQLAVLSLTNLTIMLPKAVTLIPFPVTVHVPAIEFSFGVVNDADAIEYPVQYDAVRSSMNAVYNVTMPKTTLSLSQQAQKITTNVSVACSNPSDVTANCSLLVPGTHIVSKLRSGNGAVGLLVGNDDGQKSFLNSFVGTQHMLDFEMVPSSSGRQQIDTFLNANNNRLLGSSTDDTDDSSSWCTNVAVDGTQSASTCYTNADAYFDNYFYIDTPSGNLVTLATVVSWTKHGDFVLTATSELSYYYGQYFGKYDLLFNDTSSALHFDLLVNDNDEEVLFSDLNATWAYDTVSGQSSQQLAVDDTPYKHYAEGNGINLVRYYDEEVAVTAAKFFVGGDSDDGYVSLAVADNATTSGPSDLTTGLNLEWDVSNSVNWQVELTDFEFSLYGYQYFAVDSLWNLDVTDDDDWGQFSVFTSNHPNGEIEYLDSNLLAWQFSNSYQNGLVKLQSEQDLPNGNVSTSFNANFVYGDNEYSFVTQDFINASSAHTVFLADAQGSYGGNQYDWFGTIDESDVVLDGSQVAGVTGSIYYVVPSGGMMGSIRSHVSDIVDGNEQYVGDSSLLWDLTEGGSVGSIAAVSKGSLASGPLFNTTAQVTYNVPSSGLSGSIQGFVQDLVDETTLLYGDVDLDWTIYDGGSSATVTAYSEAEVESGVVYDLTSDFSYGQNAYNLYIDETIGSFLTTATGGYGGNEYDWHGSITDSTVVVDANQVASIVGDIEYVVPAGGMTGSISMQATDTVNGKLEFDGDAGVTWAFESNGAIGLIDAVSSTALSSGAVYNATGVVTYGDNIYSVFIEDTTSDFLAAAEGGYGGNQYDWHGSIVDSTVVVSGSQVASLVGDIVYQVPAGGLTGSVATQLVDTVNGDLQFSGDAGVNWEFQDSGALGLVHAKSTASLSSGPVYNASGLVDYGNNEYFVSFQDTTSEFIAEAQGTYGGNQFDWHGSISESTVVVNGNQVAGVVGNIVYLVPAGGMTGSIITEMVDTVNGDLQFDGNAAVGWSLTDGGAMGTVHARSTASLASGPVYNASGLVDYGSNQYYLNIVDTTSNFLTQAEGAYGGNEYDWHGSITQSTVVVSGNQVASVVGNIVYVVPSGGMTGSIITEVVDTANGDMQFDGNAAVAWTFNSNGAIGHVSTRSAAVVASGAVYNASGLLDYGNNEYSLTIVDATSSFLTDAMGTYGGDQYDWYFTIAQSEVIVSGSEQAAITGSIYYDVPSSGMAGSIISEARDTVNGELQYFGNLGLKWDLEDGGNVGAFHAHSLSELASGYVYNMTGEVDYGDNRYLLSVAETVAEFLVNAMGTYGGDQYDWQFAITESDLIVNDEQLASVVGEIVYMVPSGASTGAITAQATDTVNGEVDFNGNLALHWSFEEAGSVGYVTAKSYAMVSGSGDVYNVTAILDYGDDAYSLSVVDPTSEFLSYATGTYGGNCYDWFGTILSSNVELNGEQLASVVGRVSYAVPADASTGAVALTVTDTVNDDVQFFTNNAISWQYGAEIIEASAFSVAALADNDEVYNARGTLTVNMAEEAYAISIADIPNDYMQLYCEVIGGYDLTGKSNSYAITTTWDNALIFTMGGRYDVKTNNNPTLPPVPLDANYTVTYGFMSNATLSYFDIGVLPSFGIADAIIFSQSVVDSLSTSNVTDAHTEVTFMGPIINLDGDDVGSNGGASTAEAQWQFMITQTLFSSTPIEDDMIFDAFQELLGIFQTDSVATGDLLSTLQVNAMRGGSLALEAVATISVQSADTYQLVDAPTHAPSFPPTFTPTSRPTAYSTVAPSFRPTTLPTFAPTFSPTNAVYTVAVFATHQMLENATAEALAEPAALAAFVNTVAEFMTGITNQDVDVLNIANAPQQSVVLHFLRAAADPDAAMPTVAMTYNVTFLVAGLTSEEVQDSYSSLCSQLSTAITSGTFTTALHVQADAEGSNATAALAGAQADQAPVYSPPFIVGVRTPAPTLSPTSTKNSQALATGAIVGIVVGAVALIALVAAVIYVRMCRGRSNNRAATTSDIAVNPLSKIRGENNSAFV